MPLDPAIAINARAPQMQSPLRTLGGILELRDRQEFNRQRQLQNEQRQRDLDDDDAIRDTLQRSSTPDAAIDSLYQQGRSTAAGVLSKQLYAHRTAVAGEVEKRVKAQQAQVDFAARILQSASDQGSWDTARTAVQNVLDPALFQHVPVQYDPKKQTELVEWGMSVSDKLKKHQDAIDNANKAWDLQLRQSADFRARQKANQDAREYWTKSASSLLSTSHDQGEWDGYQRVLANQGAPTDVLAMFGNRWSPEAVKKATKLGMNPHEAESVRQRDAEIRIRQQNADRLEDEDGAGGAGRGRGLTANRLSEIAEYKQRQFAALEEAIQGDPDNFDTDGELKSAARRVLVQRKLRIEDASREMQGLPPLEETEASLVGIPGREKDLTKIRNVYRLLTNGQDTPLQQMEKLVGAIKRERDAAKVSELRRSLARLREDYRARTGR